MPDGFLGAIQRLPIYIILGVAKVLLWILDKGPFFPPFGSSR